MVELIFVLNSTVAYCCVVCCRFSFFVGFFIWFAIAPLLPEIQESLGLSKEQIWNSSIASVGGTILIRFILGPLCDKYGSRVLFTVVLCGASIPTACTGLVQTSQGLNILRAFIGLAGGTFVMCQYWTSRMFSKEVVGTANALVGGWGNLGGSVTQIVMGSFLFPVFTSFYDGDTERAWRTVSVVPAVIAFATGIVVYFISDDAPKGNYREMKKNKTMDDVPALESFVTAGLDWNTWILFIHYACCFGVELTMNNATALYFRVRKNTACYQPLLLRSTMLLPLIYPCFSRRMFSVNRRNQQLLLRLYLDG